MYPYITITMPNVHLDENTYEKLKSLKKRLENTKGGTWFYRNVIRRALEVLEEVEFDGR